MASVPTTLQRYIVPGGVLSDTGHLLRERGQRGLEAVVLWVGTVEDDTTATVTHAIRPGQVAYRDAGGGCAVEVPPDALSDVIRTLPSNHFVLVRVHTHPGPAYHSKVDDTNMLIGHEGAISIVVPDFAAAAMELSACSVNQLTHSRGWVELTPAQVRARFEVLA
ncbi:Mov34/MPN/PAD-1 family protein [Knoellia koreensis]|uniref:JAB domain-containing protein n=1 Tax=Knoellia koreensis TaxID=2730921 RepID=A0A849HIG6_9MICO|nr:Mov34/MPN/PAD-1 family protein [Knoellia sp. DB2414S]NNM47032.1 hypothetical protein [Knoellia sp. DB2414S]